MGMEKGPEGQSPGAQLAIGKHAMQTICLGPFPLPGPMRLTHVEVLMTVPTSTSRLTGTETLQKRLLNVDRSSSNPQPESLSLQLGQKEWQYGLQKRFNFWHNPVTATLVRSFVTKLSGDLEI